MPIYTGRFTITSGTTTAAGTPYDNSVSFLAATNVQDALDELADLGITQVDVVADITARDALTPDTGDVAKVLDSFDDTGLNEPQTYIWDGSSWISILETSDVVSVNGQTQIVVLDAGDIGYSNGTSGLVATDVQAAIDELDSVIDGLVVDQHVAVTIAVDGVSDDALSITAGQVLTANLATGATDGVMSSADKTKLDGIEAGATADQDADEVPYDNSGSGLTATDVQGALDELDTSVDSLLADQHVAVTLDAGGTTQDAANLVGQELELVLATTTTDGVMSAADKLKLDGIETGATADQDADEVPYDNSTSGLTATDVQAALDEIDATVDGLSASSHAPVTIAVDGVSDDALSITAGQVLTANLATGATDGVMSSADKTKLDGIEAGATADQDADEVPYDNSTSGLTATDVQAALDELDTSVDSLLADQHVAVTLDAGGTTQDAANLVGQELELVLATTTTDGVMSAADKLKLDGIETGATADQDADEVPYDNSGSGLTATDVQAALDELDTSVDSLLGDQHVAVTLEAGTVTQDSANLVGQELELVAATDTNSGVLTDTAQTIGGVKTFTTEVPIVIDSPSTAGNLEIGYLTGTSIDCYGIRRSDAAGVFCLMGNADNPQIFLGNESNTTGSGFIDVDNNRPLNLNVLDTGAGSPAVVNIGSGGLNINSGGDLDLDGGDITLAATFTVDGVDVGSPKNSIEVDSEQYQLVGDLAAPGANQVYGTNGAGVKGWKADPAGGVTSIDDLSDVDTTTIAPVTGNLLYWDGANWIPTEDPTFRFTVMDGTCISNWIDTTGLDFCNTQIGPTAGSAFYIGQRALGSIATPTAIGSGVKIAGYSAAGYDGTAYYVGSEINFFSTEAFNATDGGTEMRFQTTPNGTQTQATRLVIEQDGTLNVADQTDYETKVTADDDIPNKKYVDDTPSWSFSVGRNAANQPIQALRRQNGLPTNLNPYVVPVDCIIYAVTAENQPADTAPTWTMDVEVNGGVVHTETVPAGTDHKSFTSGLSIAVSAGDEIVMRMATQSAVVDYPGGTVFFRATI